jgi:hypothetical protein
VRIPRGIVLPWLLDGQLWQLKVRTNRENPKYLAISGGHPCLFGADTLVVGEPAILAEGEFDAMLLWQEAGDLIGMATLGCCNGGVSPKALRYCWAAHGWWWPTMSTLRARRAPSAYRSCHLAYTASGRRRARDVTAFWQAGARVRDRVRFELARLHVATTGGT